MDGYLTIGTEIDNSGFDAEIAQLENKLGKAKDDLALALNSDEYTSNEIIDLQVNVDKLTRKLDKLKEKQAEIARNDWDTLKEKAKDTENSITSIISKIGKWAMAIFSLRSAYSGIQRIMSTIRTYNDQINTDLQYMQYGIASAFEPIMEKIVQLAYRLLVYINMIAKAWFGVDLFKNAGADKFAASLNKAQKSAEKMKKSLAGFDTANVLSDNSSDSSGGNSGGGIPSFDLTSPDDVPVPTWLQWIMDNKDLILEVLKGIGIAILAWKFVEFLSQFEWFNNLLDLASKGLTTLLSNITLIQGLGIAVMIVGIILLIKDVIAFLKDPTWEGFGKILIDIGIILAGLALIIGGIPLIVAAAVALIVGLIITNWDKIWAVLSKVGEFLKKNVVDPAIDFFKFMGQQIWLIIKQPIDQIKNYISGITNAVKTVWSGVRQILNGDVKGGIQTIFKGIGNIVITTINWLIDSLNTIISPIRLLVVAVGKVMGKSWTMDNIKIPRIKYLKYGGIIDAPKTGVSLTNDVRGGEAGPEAVLPLTEEVYQKLGKAIARYISIQIDLTGKVDKRQLFRIIKEILSEEQFAKNGG